MQEPLVIVALIGAVASIANTVLSHLVRRETKSPNGTRTGAAVIETKEQVESIATTLAALATSFANHTGDQTRHAVEQTRDVASRSKRKGS